MTQMRDTERLLRERIEELAGALRAIQAVAVMAQNHHADSMRVEYLREIENRAREALVGGQA